MKKISLFFLFSLFSLLSQAQELIEKEIATQIDEVIVFMDGAQINRQKTIEMSAGTNLLKFKGLSPFIDAKSIQLKADGDLNVLALNFQKNYLNEEKKSEQIKSLEQKLKSLEDKIRIEKTHLAILKEEFDFLKDNRLIGGKNEQLTVANLKEAAVFYSDKMSALKFKEIERSETVQQLERQRNDMQKQIATLTSDTHFPSGEIWVKVEATKAHQAFFNLNYIVENAGWFPSYDVRAKSIDQPLEIAYKANVHQDTKEDWTNVKISFSSSNPKSGGIAPELIPYYLNYGSFPPQYTKKFNTVSGRVVDQNNQAIAGANILIQGSSIGTISDLDGNYSIAVPANGGNLVCSFIGMKTAERFIDNPYINFRLVSETLYLEEIATAADFRFEKSAEMRGTEMQMRGMVAPTTNNLVSAMPPPTIQVKNQTGFAFQLEKPYSLKSDNKTQVVVMQEMKLPADFQYFCIPKIDPDAFLTASITNWEKLNLMEAEANVFFEDTYIGKSLLDVRDAGDTLKISLGRDKNVQIKREMQKDFSSKQFIGNKKEESRAWTIQVKNNKKQAINLVLLDQIPVPTLEEIELSIQKLSGAKYNKANGELKWELRLAPLETKTMEVKYTLKYPKDHTLIFN